DYTYAQCKHDSLNANAGSTDWFSLECYAVNASLAARGCYHSSTGDCGYTLVTADKKTGPISINCSDFLVNESLGRQAIDAAFTETGITDSWTDKQIYTRNASAQNLGLWDKAARLANQFWTINYVTNGESWQGTMSLPPSLYQAEFAKKTYEQLKLTVEDLINATKTG
ncbi:MAG: hypothetical protein V1735_00210, partial [Nanoarchaeota archaeon]